MLCFSAIGLCRADSFMDGCSRNTIVEKLGNPLREIGTGRGVLLFYGSVFLEIENDGVIFINVPSYEGLERKRMHDASRGVLWGRNVPIRSAATGLNGHRMMTEEEKKEWLEAKHRRREQLIEMRVRRFLLTRTFRAILEQHPFIQLSLSRADHQSDTSVQELIDSWNGNFSPQKSVSFLNLKDSNGVPVPAVGEERRFVERHVAFDELLLSPSLAAASLR